MKVIILCGGFGSRLSSIISDRPKSLAPIAGKPFLEHIINWLTKYGYHDLIFSVHHKASQIQEFIQDGSKFNVKAQFCLEKIPQGTGGAIKFAASKLTSKDEQALVINGDTFFDINLDNFLEFHNKNKSFATIALSHVLDVSSYGEINLDAQKKIISFTQNPATNSHPRAGLVNGGVYMLSRSAIAKITQLTPPFSIERDFFAKSISIEPVYGYASDTTHYDIGTPTGFRKTDSFLNRFGQIIIRSRAPLRISFGGGGTDVPPFDLKHEGAVLNCAINKYTYGLLKIREDRQVKVASSHYRRSLIYEDVKDIKFDGHLDLIKAVIKRMNVNYGFELYIRSDVPPRSGLGSSASTVAATIGLFNHLSVEKKMTKSQIAELSYQIETEDLKIKGGRQDQYATVFGGINFMEFLGHDFVKLSPLTLDKPLIYELERNLLIAYVGKRRESGKIHSFNKLNSKSVAYLQEMKKLGYESYYSLLRKDLTGFGLLLEKTWDLKKKAFVHSSTRYIDSLYQAAKKAGAIGGRVTGAGGGGHMIFYCQTGKEWDVANAIQALGAKVVDFSFDFDGLQTWEI